jgi:hypothetical protein
MNIEDIKELELEQKTIPKDSMSGTIRFSLSVFDICDKINEIIRVVNKLKKEKE